MINENSWQPLYCENSHCKHFLAFHNNVSLIFGGALIEQPRTNLLCNNCRKIKVYRAATGNKILRLVSENEIREIVGKTGS